MYSEDDVPSPVNVYASSKLEGERVVRQALPRALVVRTNFIGVPVKSGAGLADWIASSVESRTPIRGFEDVIFSPLLATTAAEILFEMMDERLQGLYHLGASDTISKYDLAISIARELGVPDAGIEPVKLADVKMDVRRPLNTSLLSKRAEKALGKPMPSVLDAVRGFVAQRRDMTQSTVVA